MIAISNPTINCNIHLEVQAMIRSYNHIIWIISIAVLVLFCSLTSFADEKLPTPPDWDPVLGPPIGPTEWEKANEHLYPVELGTDDPPPQPVVNPGEWERMTGVLIRYPLGISLDIVSEMSEDVLVVTIVSSTSQQQTVWNQYNNAGVNMANTDWLIAASNSMWTRDYGPWFTFIGTDEQAISNHTYNRPTRPDDNRIPEEFGTAYGIPVYDLPLTHTGGNYMSGGMGISMSTDLVYNENSGMSQWEVDQIMDDYLGVGFYDVMPDILGGGIHHIDCWAKMLDPGRILAKRLDPPNATLEANVAYWESQTSSYGVPYEVIRVDCYSSTPYTNSLILNDKVLVPLFGGSLDAQALQTYQDALPGYEILGFNGSWVSDDAIHCRTMGITDRYMLRIVHVPLTDQENSGQGYEVEADIHVYSDMPLSPGMPEIMWKIEGGNYSSAPMTLQGDDIYVGNIPEQPDFSTIYYYVYAEDESGRRENHPFIGAPNPHHFMVAPDTIPPLIVHDPLPDLSTYEWPPIIEAEITDNTGIAVALVEYSINGIPQPPIGMTNVGSIYSCTLDGNVIVGDTYEYRIFAVDASGAGNGAYSPESGMYTGEILPAVLADMEDGAPDWTHSIILPGFNDEWHLSTQQNHTSGGVQSWKCGDTGFGNYGNLLDAGLVSQEFIIEDGARLSFWHMMSAEISTSYPGYAYDGSLVEMSVDGGGWTQIDPDGGYPYLVRVGSNPGPFEAETPIFSGMTSGWEFVSFDLTGVSGDVRFRFRFGSDGSAAEEGWFVDDVLVVMGGSVPPPAMIVEVDYVSGSPIPAGGGTLYYAIWGENQGSTALDYDIWIDKIYESTDTTTLILREITNYQPGWQINRPDAWFPVPPDWPGGNYEFRIYSGWHPEYDIWHTDAFSWVKDGAVDLGYDFEANLPLNAPDPFAEIMSGVEYSIPESFDVVGVYPNPFNPTTVLSYKLPDASLVKLSVYDISGRLVTELVNGWRDAGVHEVTFDGSDLASGIYIYHLTAGEFSANGKMVLMK
ncbi:hypothetical protein CEE37_06435 [candidate division LCP-89 bacterium B3_LCP]|uniref:Secretion system C-terminal sorting domain-containing protein n=1 Tax=candidate division LCP-89 bacterium B3_LCP TaxID=2012998 RepID=A0A532V2D2_UNCL8|nr:MAG: hypothetical protein CEE37_06435 [candidate division LCP-89 bacterium B3_LCP]